jgi:ABC-type transport system substrate-binding protein
MFLRDLSLTRRRLLGYGVTTGLATLLWNGPGDAQAATVNAVGRSLPGNAAAPGDQVLRVFSASAETIDRAISLYKLPFNTSSNPWGDLLSNPLVRADKNLQVVPAGASYWDVSADHLSWTFHLDPKQIWSDGTPVTADDYVETFRFEVDPKHAWDFAWYFDEIGIKGWHEALAGSLLPAQIGVEKGQDEHTLVVTTTTPIPFLPQALIYSTPLNANHLAKYGPYYNNDPKTSISSGPYALQEWTKGQRIVYTANPRYQGVKPYITRVVVTFADMDTEFEAYQNNEIDVCGNFSPADLKTIAGNPTLNAQYHRGFDDFRIYYLGFDTNKPPFNDLRVRQAFSHAVDREALAKYIIGIQGVPAYAMLAPGFPGSHESDLKDIQAYNPALAKSLLAAAGFPQGKGFPKLNMWLRSENALGLAVGNAIAAGLTQVLGISVEVSNEETKMFMSTLNAHNLQFYMVPYGMDYLDPSNMLGVFVSGGRETWKNAQFDSLVKSATSMWGDQAKRLDLFHQAEKILISDVGMVPVFYPKPGFMWKPYVAGDSLTTDKFGLTVWPWQGWAGEGQMFQTVYITKGVKRS